jgi:NADH:ubiquinone oxidoreductase subunit K
VNVFRKNFTKYYISICISFYAVWNGFISVEQNLKLLKASLAALFFIVLVTGVKSWKLNIIKKTSILIMIPL